MAGLRVEEHPLGERRLAGIDVGHDADVADALSERALGPSHPLHGADAEQGQAVCGGPGR